MKPVSSNNWTPQYKKTFAAGKEDFKPTLISECDVHDPFYFCFNCLKAPTKWKLDLKQTQSLIALKCWCGDETCDKELVELRAIKNKFEK